MRKSIFLALAVLFMGAVAFVAVPAYAEYDQSDIMNDQIDHTTMSGMGPLYYVAGEGTGNAIGHNKDDNPEYGNPTIYIPYEGSYAWPGCSPVISLETGLPVSPIYACDSADVDTEKSDKIISDIFAAVFEGDSSKASGSQGITQVYDGFFSLLESSPDTVSGVADAPRLLISDTLDQELADLSTVTSDGGVFGIYQRLHVAFSRLYDESVVTGGGYDEDGIDQTVIAVMQEDSGAVELNDYTGAPLDSGMVISYMAQWFQKGAPQDCAPDGVGDPDFCVHDEFGGHTVPVTGDVFSPAASITQHDP
jgi:hypothetical protein